VRLVRRKTCVERLHRRYYLSPVGDVLFWREPISKDILLLKGIGSERYVQEPTPLAITKRDRRGAWADAACRTYGEVSNRFWVVVDIDSATRRIFNGYTYRIKRLEEWSW